MPILTPCANAGAATKRPPAAISALHHADFIHASEPFLEHDPEKWLPAFPKKIMLKQKHRAG
jgi:hypothetical protein